MREGSEDDQLVELEINKLKKNINHEEKSAENTMKWSDLKTKPVQKAMTIGVVMVALNQFSGCVAMLNYTATIFEEAGSNMSPNLSAIIVGIIQVIFDFVFNLFYHFHHYQFLFLHCFRYVEH